MISDPQSLKTLTVPEVRQFIEEGYVLVRGAFPRTVAEEVIALIWSEAPIDPLDRSTWERKRYVIQKDLKNNATPGLYSRRVSDAFDDLLGAGRYQQPEGTGYALLGLPGFAAPPWTTPTDGWHIDGIHFHHHVNSREQGLIGLFLYTDIEPGGGGTVVRPGSHRITARILHEAEPEGLPHQELSFRVAAQVRDLPVIEVTGNAGDMVVMHPHLYHGSSDNVRERIRIASNICIGLNEPMNFNRPDATDYSPVERAILEPAAAG